MKEFIEKAWKFVQKIGKLLEGEPVDERRIIARKVCGKYRVWKYGPLRICIEMVASYFPENYQLDEEVLKAANVAGNIYSPKAMLYYLLSHARKVDRKIKPNFKSENEYLAFIDEIIQEATTIPLKI